MDKIGRVQDARGRGILRGRWIEKTCRAGKGDKGQAEEGKKVKINGRLFESLPEFVPEDGEKHLVGKFYSGGCKCTFCRICRILKSSGRLSCNVWTVARPVGVKP